MAGCIVLLSKTVTSAGTAVPLSATSLPIAGFILQAKATNTGVIYVGDSAVSSTTGLKLGVPVSTQTPPSVTIESGSALNQYNLQDVYIDSSVNGEGVNVLYWIR